MTFFRLFLGVILASLIIYTLIVIYHHGMGLLPIFFGDMIAMTWPGQFNFDFFGFLLLSGLWVSWRNNFTVTGFMLGLLAVFGGILFLSAYLLWLTFKTNGDMQRLMLGDIRAEQR